MSGGCDRQVEVEAEFRVLSVTGASALLGCGPDSLQVVGRRPLRGQRRKPDLKQESRLDQLFKERVRRSRLKFQGRCRPGAGLGKKERADPVTALDEAHRLEAMNGLAQRDRPTASCLAVPPQPAGGRRL